MFFLFDFQKKSNASPITGIEPDQIIQPDVERHPQQRDFRHAVADAREQDIKRSQRSKRIADIRYQPDDRVQPEPPPRPRNAKQPVQIPRKIVETFLDLDDAAFLSRYPETRFSRCFFHIHYLSTQAACPSTASPPFSFDGVGFHPFFSRFSNSSSAVCG